MKTPAPSPPANRLHIGSIVSLISAVAIALLLGTGLETYLNQERRLVSAGHDIVTALKAYRAASPGSAKELPHSLDELLHDPECWRTKGISPRSPLTP